MLLILLAGIKKNVPVLNTLVSNSELGPQRDSLAIAFITLSNVSSKFLKLPKAKKPTEKIFFNKIHLSAQILINVPSSEVKKIETKTEEDWSY